MCGLVESLDWAGMPVAEFCTSGSSGIGDAHAELADLAGDAVTWLDQRRFETGTGYDDVAAWVQDVLGAYNGE